MHIKPGERVVGVVPELLGRWFAMRADVPGGIWVQRIEAHVIVERPYHHMADVAPGARHLAFEPVAFDDEASTLAVGDDHHGFFAVVVADTEERAIELARAELPAEP